MSQGFDPDDLPDDPLDDLLDDHDIDPPKLTTDDLMRVPQGSIVLNPKVKSKPERNPLCPVCEAEIHEHVLANGTIEFRCDCDDLQLFTFEREDTP